MDPFTIILEGNICSGKSSFGKQLVENIRTNKLIRFIDEPVNEWADLYGNNLFKLFYENPKEWAFAFESYVQLTMLKNHKLKFNENKCIKLMERSIYSAHYIFNKCLYDEGNIDEINYFILNEWFNHITCNESIRVDLIIYLKTKPENCEIRIKNRNRLGEEKITLDYLNKLDILYDNWLAGPYTKIKTIIIPNDQSFNDLEKSIIDLIDYLKMHQLM